MHDAMVNKVYYFYIYAAIRLNIDFYLQKIPNWAHNLFRQKLPGTDRNDRESKNPSGIEGKNEWL